AFQTRRLLKKLRPSSRTGRGAATEAAGPLSDYDTGLCDAHSAAMIASLFGWFVCSFFASVAYSWTFYYLLALAATPREMLKPLVPAVGGRAGARGGASAARGG